MRQYSVLSEKPRNISAGMVKITPAATDSPAEPVVCTMLFSRIVDRPNARRMLIESTAMGIEAETVSPARKPDVYRNGAEQDAEQRTEHHGAQAEFADVLLRRPRRGGIRPAVRSNSTAWFPRLPPWRF